MKKFRQIAAACCMILLLTGCAGNAEEDILDGVFGQSMQESIGIEESKVEDDETEGGKTQSAEVLQAYLPEEVIAEQSFEVNLDDWGSVEFVSVKPDEEKRKDVSFYLVKDDRIVYAFPAIERSGFRSVAAVAFKDINEDGKIDVITLIEREAEDGSTYNDCVVYQQENKDTPKCMETEMLEAYKVTQALDAEPAFFRDTLMEEYFAKQQLTDRIDTIIDSYGDYMRYVRSFCLTEEIPGEFPLHFFFSSGAGAWSTELTLYSDASFDGLYNDSDMGSSGEGYPGGTRYTCSFSGEFGDIVKLNDYSYSIKIKNLVTEREIGEEWLADDVLYVSSEPYGLAGGEEFILYTPQAPAGELSEDFLSWYSLDLPAKGESLGCYGIYNVKTGDGFFSY